jgi:hypothetical protein
VKLNLTKELIEELFGNESALGMADLVFIVWHNYLR